MRIAQALGLHTTLPQTLAPEEAQSRMRARLWAVAFTLDQYVAQRVALGICQAGQDEANHGPVVVTFL